MDGEEVASAVEVVEGFEKRLLMSNFLSDGSDKAGVIALVEFVAVVDIWAELDAVDTDDTDEDLQLTWPNDDVVGAVVGLPNETEDFATGAGNRGVQVVTVGSSPMDPKVTSVP